MRLDATVTDGWDGASVTSAREPERVADVSDGASVAVVREPVSETCVGVSAGVYGKNV